MIEQREDLGNNSEASVQIEIYDSAEQAPPFFDEIIRIFKKRFILRRMIYSSFKTKYRRSYLGIIWSLLNPLLYMLVFILIFSKLFTNRVQNYPLYLLSGSMFFSFFSSSTSDSMRQLIANSAMIRRVNLPKTIYILSVVGVNTINLVLTFLLFVVVAVFEKLEISYTAFFVLPSILLLLGFVIGISLLVATITTYLNDFSQLWSVIITLWTYLTPIFYPESIIPEQILFIYQLNPMYIYIKIFRTVLLYKSLPSAELWINGSIFSLLSLIFGWWVFTKHSNEFAYRM